MKSFEYSGIDNLDVMSLAQNYNNFLLGLISKFASKSGSIVDFGAGSGTYAKEVAKTTKNLICIEPDSKLQSTLNQAGLQTFSDISEIKTAEIDFVYSFNVLEHIENDIESLSEIFRILKPGSRCLIYVPAMQFLYSAMDTKVGHFRRYSLNEMKKKASQVGFEIDVSRYADSIGVLATLAYKIIGDKSGGISPKSLVTYDRFIFPISKALDQITYPVCGKNLFVVLRKPENYAITST